MDKALAALAVRQICKIRVNPNSEQQFLGGGSINKIPSDSTYASLPRAAPQNIASLHSAAAGFFDKRAERAFMKVFTGDCSIEYGTGCVEGHPFCVVAAHIDEADPESDFQGRFITVAIPVHQESGGDKRFAAGILPVFSNDVSAFSDDQARALYNRLLHLFLRVYGTALDEDLFDILFTSVRTAYVKMKQWKELYDLGMIRADVSFNNSWEPQCIVTALVHVGEFLESCGYYSKAATIYEEIMTKFWFEGMPLEFDIEAGIIGAEAQMYNLAAVARKRAQQFIKSEKLFLMAAHLDLRYPSSDPRIFNNIICLYDSWCCLENNDPGASGSTFLLAVTLVALHAVLGIDVSKSGFRFHDKAEEGYLKPMYLNKKKARKVLMAATSDPDNVQKFRSTILNCRPPKAQLPADLLPSIGDSRHVSRKHVKHFVLEDTVQNLILKCCNPMCQKSRPANEIMKCPCKTAGYCDKECQLSHWKEHLKKCPYHQAKKSKKKTTSL